MNILDYARLIPQDQQMKEGWLLVRLDPWTEDIQRYDEDPEDTFDGDDDARYFVAECAAQTVYMIRHETDPELFWNNSEGYVTFESADVFSSAEQRVVNLPLEGEWIALNPHFGVRHVD